VKSQPILIEGEAYFSLETLAEIYAVEVHWLQEVYDHGLLGPGVNSGPHLCVASIQMDRVATIVRLHSCLGLDVFDIRLELDAL
jgi:hypothetical protein